MTGPYEWVPPSYWLDPASAGGATGFNTETGPGPGVPPLESLQRFLTPGARWPKGDAWAFHANGGNFATFGLYDEALAQRFGPPVDLADYLRKAAATDYESHRAMFEAWGRNRPRATGVILWMLNDAWPEVVWHLWDFWLRPLPGAWGARKALEPVHIQYAYDDGTVAVVNGTPRDLQGLKATVRLLDPSLAERFRFEGPVDVPAGDSAVVAKVPGLPVDPARTGYLRLDLADAAGTPVSTNFYWLSTVAEDLDWDFDGQGPRRWTSLADYRALADLPPVALEASASKAPVDGDDGLRVVLHNPSASLAFLVRLEVAPAPDADEVLPSFWSDNGVTLLPGETREVSVSWRAADMDLAAAAGGGDPSAPVVRLSGWNVAKALAVPAD
jgi:exo-1,4-beta-D-glucosaminidase